MKEKSSNQTTNVPDACRSNEYYYSIVVIEHDKQAMLYAYGTKDEALVKFFEFAKFEAYEYVMLYKTFNDLRIAPKNVLYLHRGGPAGQEIV